jgi:hypothetical protein
MKIAICINCGYNKGKPAVRCPNCGFTPRSDEDKAKSLMLSMYYEIDNEYRGKSKEDLLEAGRQIAAKTYRFSATEVAAVVAAAKTALQLPPASKMALDLVRWLGPVVAVIGIALYLWLHKK